VPTASRAEVIHLSCGHQSARKLAQLGIVAGAVLQMQRSAPLGGPVLVEVRGSMVALGRRLAHRVLVRILP
jgi:Fe2+ transport system protein FeoA